MKILLTGFEAYAGRTGNPSAEIAGKLDGKTIAGVAIQSSIFPVVNHGLQAHLEAAINRTTPSAIIALGLCPGEGLIRLERLAANYSNFEIPDNHGERVNGAIIPGAPAAYESTLPVSEIQADLIANGIPTRQSNTAGTYLCNALMFRALHYCAERMPQTRCGFIHLPLLPVQICDLLAADRAVVDPHHQTSIASMSLDMQIRAIELAISHLAGE